MSAPARNIQSGRAFEVHTTDPLERAMSSYLEVRRRNRARGIADTVADAAMASGGLVIANAAMNLGMGLPSGRNGIALGGAMLSAGLLWITRLVHATGSRKDPAHAMPRPVLVRMDAEAA